MKTAKEERRLQEADAEIGREFGQMTGILMDTLVRVSADLFEGGQIYGYRVERAALERELRFDPRKGCSTRTAVQLRALRITAGWL